MSSNQKQSTDATATIAALATASGLSAVEVCERLMDRITAVCDGILKDKLGATVARAYTHKPAPRTLTQRASDLSSKVDALGHTVAQLTAAELQTATDRKKTAEAAAAREAAERATTRSLVAMGKSEKDAAKIVALMRDGKSPMDAAKIVGGRHG